MPTYEYECMGEARHRFERFQRFSDPPVSQCPECGATVRRLLFPAGVIFKGPGFYTTETRKTAEATEPKAETPSAGDAGKTDAAPSKDAPAPAKPAATAAE